MTLRPTWGTRRQDARMPVAGGEKWRKHLSVSHPKKVSVNSVNFEFINFLVGGDWNHGIFHDFPFSWEFHHPNWRSPSFFRGVEETTNQCHFGRVQLGHHGCHLPPFFFASAILVASSHIHWLGETMKPRLVKIEALKTPPVLWVFWVYYL